MTALGLARNSDLFAAGVDLHGVHDWNQWQAWATERAERRRPNGVEVALRSPTSTPGARRCC